MGRVAVAWPGIDQRLDGCGGEIILQIACHREGAETQDPVGPLGGGKLAVGQPGVVAGQQATAVVMAETQAGQRFGEDRASQVVGQCGQRRGEARFRR